MVGKSAQVQTLGIALGSVKMFTAAKGSPRACITWAARFEKPHCACSGVPRREREPGQGDDGAWTEPWPPKSRVVTIERQKYFFDTT